MRQFLLNQGGIGDCGKKKEGRAIGRKNPGGSKVWLGEAGAYALRTEGPPTRERSRPVRGGEKEKGGLFSLASETNI